MALPRSPSRRPRGRGRRDARGASDRPRASGPTMEGASIRCGRTQPSRAVRHRSGSRSTRSLRALLRARVPASVTEEASDLSRAGGGAARAAAPLDSWESTRSERNRLRRRKGPHATARPRKGPNAERRVDFGRRVARGSGARRGVTIHRVVSQKSIVDAGSPRRCRVRRPSRAERRGSDEVVRAARWRRRCSGRPKNGSCAPKRAAAKALSARNDRSKSPRVAEPRCFHERVAERPRPSRARALAAKAKGALHVPVTEATASSQSASSAGKRTPRAHCRKAWRSGRAS